VIISYSCTADETNLLTISKQFRFVKKSAHYTIYDEAISLTVRRLATRRSVVDQAVAVATSDLSGVCS